MVPRQNKQLACRTEHLLGPSFSFPLPLFTASTRKWLVSQSLSSIIFYNEAVLLKVKRTMDLHSTRLFDSWAYMFCMHRYGPCRASELPMHGRVKHAFSADVVSPLSSGWSLWSVSLIAQGVGDPCTTFASLSQRVMHNL